MHFNIYKQYTDNTSKRRQILSFFTDTTDKLRTVLTNLHITDKPRYQLEY